MAQQFNGFLVVRDINGALDMKAGELLDAIFSGIVAVVVFTQTTPRLLVTTDVIDTARKNDDSTYTFVAGPTTYNAATADDYPESE